MSYGSTIATMLNRTLGYEGSINKKKHIVQRMKDHIAKDELVKDLGYIRRIHNTPELVGCAVACIAYENLSKGKSLYAYEDHEMLALHLHGEVDRILNITGIGVLIDILHEDQDEMTSFPLDILEVIQTDVDYRHLLDDYIDGHEMVEAVRDLANEKDGIIRGYDIRDGIRRVLERHSCTARGLVEHVLKFNQTWRAGRDPH